MKRLHYVNRIQKAFKTHKVAALLGTRQCGKITLFWSSKKSVYFYLTRTQAIAQSFKGITDPNEV